MQLHTHSRIKLTITTATAYSMLLMSLSVSLCSIALTACLWVQNLFQVSQHCEYNLFIQLCLLLPGTLKLPVSSGARRTCPGVLIRFTTAACFLHHLGPLVLMWRSHPAGLTTPGHRNKGVFRLGKHLGEGQREWASSGAAVRMSTGATLGHVGARATKTMSRRLSKVGKVVRPAQRHKPSAPHH